MTYIAVLICYILVWISAAQDPYNIFDDEKKWEEAKQRCSMATPEIDYKDMTVSVQIEQDPMPELWTGYYKTMIGFEYFGCVKKSNVSSSRILEIERNSPGHCYSACGKNKIIVGLNNRTCYCLNRIDRHIINEASCDISCPAPFVGIACGGKYHMSLYRINANVSSGINGYSGNNNLHCVRIERNKNLLWDLCSGSLRILCETEQSMIDNYDTETGQNNFEWNIANNKCFENSLRPVIYANVLNVVDLHGVSWTGMCRSFVHFKYTESHVEDIHIEYGYLKRYKDSSKIYLEFTDGKNVKKKTLCKYDPLETTSLESTALTTVTTQGESGDETSSSHATTNSLPSKTTTAKTTPSNNITRTEEKAHGENNRVPFGVSVAVVLIIVSVVIIAVILRRRGKIPDMYCFGPSSKKSADGTRSMHALNNDMDHTSEGPAFGRNDALESQKKTDANKDDSLDNSNYEHTYFVLEEHMKESNSDYDKCAYGKKSRTENDTGYNTLNMAINSKRTDNTYDTTEKAALKMKPANGRSEKFCDSGEDTYNHINNNPLTNSKTDNVYGAPGNLENAYGDCRNDMHFEGDDYSHINSIKQERSKPDNNYSTS